MLNDEMREQLIQAALEARQWAYAPYSSYPVGAALLATSGKVYIGVNVENAAYPTTMCAERVAVFNAVTQGERSFVAIVVATSNGGSPCGSCRQVLAEFGLETRVLCIDDNGQVIVDASLAELLPGAFRPEHLSGSK
jgi:cytidine deaminase